MSLGLISRRVLLAKTCHVPPASVSVLKFVGWIQSVPPPVALMVPLFVKVVGVMLMTPPDTLGLIVPVLVTLPPSMVPLMPLIVTASVRLVPVVVEMRSVLLPPRAMVPDPEIVWLPVLVTGV